MEEETNEMCFSCKSKDDVYNIFDTHRCEDIEEVYADMLKQCFDIEPAPESKLNALCRICVLKLRNAFYFKQEIIKTMEELQKSAQLQLEYLEGELDEEILQTEEMLDQYEIESELDPVTGQLAYIINDNKETEEKKEREKDEQLQKDVEKKKVKKKVRFLIDTLNEELKTQSDKESIQANRKSKENLDSGNRQAKKRPKKEKESKNAIKPKAKPKLYTIKPNQTVCDICSKAFPSNLSLRRHMHTHYPRHECHQCGKSFANTKSLNQHLETHFDGPWACGICDMIFSKQNTRNAHIWRVHKNKQPYPCSECGERFKTFHQRLRHLQNAHARTEPKYPCPHCDKKFFYAGARSLHIRLSHLKERNHKCEMCPLAFGRRRELTSHMATIHDIGDKLHQCEICQKTFFKNITLRYHIKNTHGKVDKKFNCVKCGAQFGFKATLMNHLKCHEIDEAEQTVTVEVEDFILDGSNNTVYLDITEM